MARKRTSRPTDSELEILKVLWEKERATVREVAEALGEKRSIGYTTVLKLLQIMYGKGTVTRDESNRTHVYAPAERPKKARGDLVGGFVDRVFGGSRTELVSALIDDEKIDEEELKRLRRLIDRKLRDRKQEPSDG